VHGPLMLVIKEGHSGSCRVGKKIQKILKGFWVGYVLNGPGGGLVPRLKVWLGALVKKSVPMHESFIYTLRKGHLLMRDEEKGNAGPPPDPISRAGGGKSGCRLLIRHSHGGDRGGFGKERKRLIAFVVNQVDQATHPGHLPYRVPRGV